MVKHRKKFALITICFVCCSFISLNYFTSQDNAVPYPEGYREWTHVKTAVVEPGNAAFDHFGGFHHIYANKLAMEGYKTANFADGSVIVFDVLEAIDTTKLLLERRRRQLDVMVRNTNRYASTGGWGFEEFRGDSKTERTVMNAASTTCYSCHSRKASLVFSEWRR